MNPDFRPHRFSTWDGTQDPLGPDGDEVFDRLAEDVFQGWDFESALRRLLGQGWRDAEGRRMQGLEEMLERLRKRRQQQLQRYSLDGIFKDIREKLDTIVRTEREGIEQRLESTHEPTSRRLMERVVRQRRASLDGLPDEPGGAIRQLRDYEWMEPRAEQQFQRLLEEMQQAVTQTYFRDMTESMQQLSGEDLSRVREMVHDLNALMHQRLEGVPKQQLQVNYQQFLRRHGSFFPDAPADFDAFVEHLQRQLAQMDSLMQSLSPEMRRQLDELMAASLADDELQAELAALMGALELLSPRPQGGQGYSFLGGDQIPLAEAMRLMGRLQSMEELEQALAEVYRGGALDPATREQLREALGEEAAQSLDQLDQMTRRLQERGLVAREGRGLQLTARGMRRIGQKALGDLFDRLKRDRFGDHRLRREGQVGDRADTHKPYEFGDAFDLDVEATLMNAVRREAGAGRRGETEAPAGPGRIPRLAPEDFEIHQSEAQTRTSTVLMLDMSRSMPLRGYFYAAKKVALALDSLIRTQYPRDALHIIGFSDYARAISSADLPQLSVNEYVYGTNLQHGLMMARRLLARDRAANKQILIVSDGEPTAHMEGKHAVFFYPPLPETFQKTLLEVQRCTREDIIINTFMLESNHNLVQFVNQMTRLNGGRTFFISPDRLGDYVLVDYVRSRNARRSGVA